MVITLINHLDLAKLADRSYSLDTHKGPGDVEAIVTRRKDALVIAFRGTEITGGVSWRDVLRDIRAYPSYSKVTGWSHTGIRKGAENWVKKFLITVIEQGDGRPVIVTGHSLGGGLAPLAALFLADRYVPVKEVVTFGAPRVLYRKGVDKFKEHGIKVTQYKYGNDFVTTIPWRLWGYRHVQQPLTQLAGKKGRRTWDDHDIELYIQELENVEN